MIRDYQAIQKTWFINRQQKKIPTYGKNAGVKLIGILDYETGAVYGLIGVGLIAAACTPGLNIAVATGAYAGTDEDGAHIGFGLGGSASAIGGLGTYIGCRIIGL